MFYALKNNRKMMEAVTKNYRLCNNERRVGKFEKLVVNGK